MLGGFVNFDLASTVRSLRNLVTGAKEQPVAGVDEYKYVPTDEAYRDGGYVPTSHRQIQQLIENRELFQGLLPYAVHNDEDRIFINQDSIGFVLEVLPQTGVSSETDLILSQIIASASAHTGIQAIMYASPNLTVDFKEYANLRPVDPDQDEKSGKFGRTARNENIHREMARAYINHLKKGTRHSIHNSLPALFRNLRLIYSVTIPGTGTDKERDQLRRIRNNVVGALRGAHFASVTWDVHDLIKFLKEVLNPQQPYDDFMPAYDDGRLIKAQVVNTDTVMTLKNRGDGIVCSSREGNTEIRFMSVKNYPLNWELREMERLIGDFSQMSNRYPCPFMLITGVYVLDHEAIKNMVLVKSARATQNAESPFAKYMPGLQDKKRDWDYVQRVVTEGQTLVSMYMQIMLFTDPKESDVIEQAVKALWRSSGFDLTTDVYVQVQALLSSLPMGLSKDMYADLKKFQRVTTKTSTNAICFTPFLSEWRGTETPTMLVFGKRGQAMRLSLDDNRQGNQNLIVSGASGTGKSFFYNYLMLSYMGAMNARVRHFDIGRSAEKLCNLLGGQMIEFRPEIDMRLNPFSLVVEKDFNEEMALLRPMVAQMAMPNSKPDSLQTAILDEAIRTVWDRKGNDMSVTDIAEYLREMGNKGDVNTDWISKLAERVLPRMHDEHQALHGSQEAEGSNRILPASIDEYKMLLMASTLGNGGSGRDQRMHDLARMLYPYTREGTYGRYFEGRANIDLSNDFVLLEMEELANKKELRSVVLQILIYAIQQELFTGDRSKKTLISIDEAWQLLADTGGSTAEYIENGFRRARKNGGSFVIISQNLYEVAKGDVGAAIMANSDWKILFRQDRDAFNMLLDSKRFNANETEQRIISTLQTEQGVFSEAFVRMGNNQSGVFSFWPDPFMKLLFSSNAQDYAQINQYRERGFPVTEAIHQVLKDRGIHA